MRHTTRMVLIPEELYTKLLADGGTHGSTKSTSPDKQPTPHSRRTIAAKRTTKHPRRRNEGAIAPFVAPTPAGGVTADKEDQPLAETEQRINRIQADKRMPDDVKQVQFQQEFRRLLGMQKSKANRPLQVKLWQAEREPATSNGAATTRDDPSALALSTEERHMADEIIDYMERNREKLGITAQNSILPVGKTVPVRNSDIRRSVEWQVCRGWKPAAKPPGHATFLQKANSDAFLRQRLQLGGGRKSWVAAERPAHRPKKSIGRARKEKTRSAFRPQLW